MRPLKLTMSAFGPYADNQTVDFRELGEKRFFVISGPTGAGKTSVLDAMTFALYGDTTGDERTGKDMRSLFADATVTSEVTLDFSVGAEVYRVWRRPEQERPKLRGGGMTTEKSDAGLWRRTTAVDDGDEGVVVASGVREVDRAVSELLGFDCDQFRQVVVLPQGRFREVLSADVKTREAVFRQLFKTDRFRSMTDHFKAIRNESKRAIEGLQAKRAGVFENAGVESREELDQLVTAARATEAESRVLAESAAVAAETARAALEAGREAKAVLGEVLAATTAFDALTARGNEIEERRGALAAARRAQQVQSSYDALERAGRDGERAREEHDVAVAEVPALEAALMTTCESLDKAQQAHAATGGAIDLLEREAQDAMRIADDVALLTKARGEVAAAENRYEAAREASERAGQVAHEKSMAANALDTRWRAAQAAVFAAALENGSPCPVCGSEHHPAPALGADAAVSDGELDAARSLADAAAAEAATAAASAAAAQQAVISARQRADDESRRLGASAGMSLAEARQRAQELGDELGRRKAATLRAAQDLEVCETARANAQTRLEGARVRVQERAERLRQCAAELEVARSRFGEALALAKFVDERELLAVRRTPAEIDALEGAVRSHDEALVAARDRLARAQVAAGRIVGEPDIDGLVGAERAARAAADEAQKALGNALTALEGHLKAVDIIDRFEAESRELLDRHSLVARIADVADGSNERRMSFERFVLATYLDEVLVHANHRLQRMTGGRYRLDRETRVTHRGRPSGLDLAVFDEQAGQHRPAGTLSGGEGFLASLALALGLAEAVQCHAGGVKLETIFIDEGFGTLDPEALELAIGTLLDLAGVAAEQGRLVGIISHVPELRDRIDARLEITPGERGSTARLVV